MNTTQLRGLVGKGISIYTDDPQNASVRVAVRATVYGSVELLPGYKGLISNRQSSMRTGRFLIRRERYESGELIVSEARASVDWIGVDATRVIEKIPGINGVPAALPGDWLLNLTLTNTAPYGSEMVEVRFNTGLEIEPEVLLAIATDIQPPVAFNHPQIKLVAGQPAVVLGSLRRDLDPQPIEFEVPEGLALRTEPQGRGRRMKIFLEWTGSAPDDPLELALKVAGERQTIPLVISAN